MKSLLYCSIVILTTMALMTTGCGKKEETVIQLPAEWSVEEIGTIEGLDLPECVVIDPKTGYIYISNIVTPDESYWVNDNDGFITKVKPDGTIDELRWLESTATAPIHDPKGMCILGRTLYFNDNTKIKYISLDEPGEVGVIEIEGAQKLNDLETNGEYIMATDTGAGKVYPVLIDASPKVGTATIPAPEFVNGITSYKDEVFAVSWGLHEVYQLNEDQKPEPFGLADNFTALDSIEVLEDDSFIVTDFQGNKLCWISADRKTVRTLAELTTPADVGYDRAKNLLYVPQLVENKVVIYKLTKK